MGNTRKIPADIDLAERARFYAVCERTARRWHESGADLRNPESVANLLLRQRNPAPAALKATAELLKTELQIS
jgi:hypothetical protein